MYLPTSRDNIAQVPQTINRTLDQQPAGNKVRDSASKGLYVSDLKPGDIILMLGNYPSSCLTCAATLSPVSSHVGVVLELDGKLWLIEAVSFAENDVTQWVVSDSTPKPAGVIASDIQDDIDYYSAMDVYRPYPPLLPSEIQSLQRSFYDLKGKPYEKSILQIFNVACGCPVLPTRNSIFCSELVARMFDDAGRLKTDPYCGIIPSYRAWSYSYRPSDIPNVIDCKRIGHMKGTRKIWDIRGWTFGIC